MAYNYNSSIDDRLAKIRGDVYKAQAPAASLPEFDYARKKVTEQANEANSTQQDALQRRYASMGALNSGSAIKGMQVQNDAAERRKADALEGVNVQEAQAKRVFEQDQANKEFQSAEGARGRAFGAEESQYGRDFQAGENSLTRSLQQKQMDMQGEQFNKQYEQSRYEFEKNYGLALEDLHKKDILEKFLETFMAGMGGSSFSLVKGAYDTVSSWF